MDEKARRKRSYAAGYLLSLAGKPLPLTASKPGSEPVAYLYNGVRLPDINSILTDEQKAQNPYWILNAMDAGEIDESLRGEIAYTVYFLPKTAYFGNLVRYSTTIKNVIFMEEEADVLYSSLTFSTTLAEMFGYPAGEWTPLVGEEREFLMTAGVYGEYFWSNFDILGANSVDGVLTLDGSTYLATSEPVPVYE